MRPGSGIPHCCTYAPNSSTPFWRGSAATSGRSNPATPRRLEMDAISVEPFDGTGPSYYLRDTGSWQQTREYFAHRSLYHLKEGDPHAWAIPRLTGSAKAAFVAVEFDEYGAGQGPRLHQQLFADLLAAADLDPTYLGYLDAVPAESLTVVNVMSLFGLHRWLRGAAIGHFAATEITSPPGSRRMVQALQRLGAPPACVAFYAEHVEADAVHEQVVRHDVVGDLVAREPNLDRDVVFGIRAHAVVEKRLGGQHDGGLEARTVVIATTARLGAVLIRYRDGSASTMAGVAQRIFLAARTGADRHHEPVGFHDTAVGHFDPDRARRPARGLWESPAPACRSRFVRPDHHQLLFAAAATANDRCLPATSLVPISTGPNGIHCDATTSASKPLARNKSSDCCTPANADCTNSRDPFLHNSFDADSHSGSSTSLPSGPAFHAHDGPASHGMASRSSAGGAGTYGGLDTTTSNGAQSKALVHEPSRTSTSTPASRALSREHRTACGTDIEGGDAGAAQFGGRDRDIAAAGTQIEYPPPGNDRGSLHRFHQQARILLRLIHLQQLRRSQPGRDTWWSSAGLSSVRRDRSRHDLTNARKPTRSKPECVS